MAAMRRAFGYGPAVEAIHQLVYWLTRHRKYSDEALDEGNELLSELWIWKTNAEWWDEVGLSKRQVKKARKYLVDKGCIDEKRWWGNKVYYRVNWIRLAEVLNSGCLGLPGIVEQRGGSLSDTRGMTDNTEQAGMTDSTAQPGMTGQNGGSLAAEFGENPHGKRIHADVRTPPEGNNLRSFPIQKTTSETTTENSRRGGNEFPPQQGEVLSEAQGKRRDSAGTSSYHVGFDTPPRSSAVREDGLLHRADTYMREIAREIKERGLLPLEEEERGAIANNLKWCIEWKAATPQEMDAAVCDMLLEREYDDLSLIMPCEALESWRKLKAARAARTEAEHPEPTMAADDEGEYALEPAAWTEGFNDQEDVEDMFGYIETEGGLAPLSQIVGNPEQVARLRQGRFQDTLDPGEEV